LNEHDDAARRPRAAGEAQAGMTSPGNQASDDPSRKRAPYKKPELMAWGTLGDITRAVGRSGYKDGGSGFNKWTRF
jgi:hypothetical protein